MAQKLTLLSNASATGAAALWAGGRGQFKALGSFGGSTVTLQVLGPDGATWQAVGEDATLDAAGVANFECPPGQLRAAVAGGSPSGLYAEAASL
jgi:hypothetical protein